MKIIRKFSGEAPLENMLLPIIDMQIDKIIEENISVQYNGSITTIASHDKGEIES